MGPARKRPATNHNGSAATRLTRSRTVLESGNNSEGDTTINNSSAQSQQNVNNVDQTPSEVQQVNMDEAHTGASKRNKRGKTKGYAVKRRLEEGNRIGGIIIEEGAKAPVGINEKLMKMEMGVVVRVLAPIRKFFWKEVTTEEKIPLFAKIESEFDIDMSVPYVKNMVDRIMAARFRQFKYNCHLHYKEETDPIKARENPMETVNIDDWKLLCDHFDGPAFKKQSAANVQNRAMVQNPHTTGAKSQSQRLYELNNKEVQQDSTDNDVEQNNAAEEEPPELRVYSDAHKKRNGEWINPATKKNYEDMTDLRNQAIQDGTEVSGGEIVEKVLKKKPTYARNIKRTAREVQLEAELQAERAQRQAEKESFERRSKQFEEQIEIQQQKIQSQDNKFEAMEESHNRLQATVLELAAKMNDVSRS